MKILDRLKLELSNQQYFTDEQYSQFLEENNLYAEDEYIKVKMQKPLLFTVIDILEAISNDIDTMTTISTEFSNIGEAYHFIERRIDAIKDKIASIPEPEQEYSAFSLMYTRDPYTKLHAGRKVVSKEDIDKIIHENFYEDEGVVVINGEKYI